MKTFLRNISCSRSFRLFSALLLCGLMSIFCLMGCSEENSSLGIDVSEKPDLSEQQLDSVSLSDYDHLKGYVEYVGRVSAVTLYELDSGLVFTGREFSEAVDTSNGSFDFKNGYYPEFGIGTYLTYKNFSFEFRCGREIGEPRNRFYFMTNYAFFN